MRRYWIRIALTALGIFILGMVVVSAGRRGVDRVKELAAQQSFNLIPGMAPFQVDNRRLGTLTEVNVDPDRSEGFPFIDLTVELDPQASAGSLRDCTLLASDAQSFKGTGLHCLPGLSPDTLVQMGMVTFEPSGETVNIFVPVSQVEELAWFRRSRGAAGSTPGEGSLNLQADAKGAFMLIRDDQGRPVFQLNADSQGAFIQVRDSNGREVVRFRADSQGIKGRIDH